MQLQTLEARTFTEHSFSRPVLDKKTLHDSAFAAQSVLITVTYEDLL